MLFRSHRTGKHLARPGFSAILKHAEEIHGTIPAKEDFKIINKSKDELTLRIKESILIKQKKPDLNNTLSCFVLNLV